MRRLVIGLAVAALTVLSLAGPASAATGQVTHFRFHGAFVDADWFTSSATSFTDTFINVSKSKQGSELFVDQFTGNLDANGNFTGGTDTSADVTSGFSFAIDQQRLTSASASGSGLPATTCTIDANGNPISCSATTVNVNATWTGQGPIGRSVVQRSFQVRRVQCERPLQRDQPHCHGRRDHRRLPAEPLGELQFADLGTAKSGTTTICRGISC